MENKLDELLNYISITKAGTLTMSCGEPKEADEIGKEVCLWRVAHVHT